MKLSLRVKIYFLIAALLAVLLVLLNIVPVTSSRNAVFEEKKSSLTSQGNAVASALSKLDSLSHDNVRDVLNFLDISGYSRIIATDGTGTVIYDSDGFEGAVSDIEDVQTALGGKTVFRSCFKDGAFDSSYITPLSVNDAISGSCYIREIDVERAAILLSLQGRIRTVSISVSIVTVIMTLIFTRTLLRRFGELTDSMRVVASGDYSHRLSVRGNDELSELGNEFNLLAGKLQDTEQLRRRFVSDASHELKTPLASIRLLSDSIVQNAGMDEDTMRDFVNDIGNEAERLQHTTEKLLDLSRLDDDIRVAAEPVDLKQVVVDAYVFAKPLADERSIRIRCDLDDGCIVMATVDDMFHVVFNLMENAVKYNVPCGSVDISLHSTDDSVLLTVSDTGIGIPEEDRLNIFTRFYRVDKARSREAGGSGLGLSIVHDTVKLYGGFITVGSNQPHGSIFSVRFPKPSDDETGI